MITVAGISKSFGGRTLFSDVNLRFDAGTRTAIVGPNGAGKTTLMKLLSGVDRPDSGEIAVQKGIEIGVLEQDIAEWVVGGSKGGGAPLGDGAAADQQTPDGPLPTPVDLVVEGAPVKEIEERLTELGMAMAENPEDDAVLQEFGHLQDRFEVLGGYDLDARARRILGGLGFDAETQDKPVRSRCGRRVLRGWSGRQAIPTWPGVWATRWPRRTRPCAREGACRSTYA